MLKRYTVMGSNYDAMAHYDCNASNPTRALMQWFAAFKERVNAYWLVDAVCVDESTNTELKARWEEDCAYFSNGTYDSGTTFRSTYALPGLK